MARELSRAAAGDQWFEVAESKKDAGVSERRRGWLWAGSLWLCVLGFAFKAGCDLWICWEQGQKWRVGFVVLWCFFVGTYIGRLLDRN